MERYLTTNSDVDERLQKMIDEHLTQDGWQEVFILTANLLPQADDFLLRMKEKVDNLVNDDEKVCSLLCWAQTKANSLRIPYCMQFFRVSYLILTFDLDLKFLNARNLARTLAFNIDRDLSLGVEFTLAFADSHFGDDFDRAKTVARSIQMPFALDLALSYVLSLALTRASTRFASDVPISLALHLASDYVPGDGNNALTQTLQGIKEKFPNKGSSCEEWQKWAEELREFMIKSWNIGHKREMEYSQIEILCSYLKANNLIVECLKNGSHVLKTTREKLLDELLIVRK